MIWGGFKVKVVYLGGNTKEEIERRVQIVASAGNLSRAEGTVTQVIENNNDYNTNLKLAKAIVGYGHKSISEHDYLVFALEDVTPIVEQTLIGYRLTSFTIKSRRNVDFRNVGFYVPTFKDQNGNILENNAELQYEYKNHMQQLFNKYGELVDEELPVEDCRYILPYSYYSNIIMGCDANEFLRMTSDLLYGKVSDITEMHELGERFASMIEENVPYLTKALEKEKEKSYYGDKLSFLDNLTASYLEITPENKILLNKAHMIYGANNYSKVDETICYSAIMNRYQVNHLTAERIYNELLKEDSEIGSKIINAILHSKNQREFEQVNFSFELPISLAVLTHITRHRMHSLMVPDFVPMWDLGNYIIPSSVAKDHEDDYYNVFSENKEKMEYFKDQGVRDEDLVYFYLSGNACNIHTTMNGRTLEWISRMRCCKKAQWEIRGLVNQMVQYAQKEAPIFGTTLGPSCVVEGICPEGKDSCQNRGIVKKKGSK